MAALGFLKTNKKTAAASPKKTASLPQRLRPSLMRPVLSEKATRVKETDNAYIFQIAAHANKTTVAKEIESLYKVHVTKVGIIHVPPKPKRTGRFSGYRSGYRKAMVHIKSGEKIELI